MYQFNSHGDVIGLTDNNGTLTETYTYDAFGTLTYIQSLNEDGILAEAGTALSRFLYAGEQFDEVAGLYYLRARRYDTTVGRFTQEDTYLGDGRNLYVYVQNNPLKYADPSGYCSKSSGYTYMYNELFPAPWEPNFLYADQMLEEEKWYERYWERVANDPWGYTANIADGYVQGVIGTVTLGSAQYMDGNRAIYPDAFFLGEVIGSETIATLAKKVTEDLVAKGLTFSFGSGGVGALVVAPATYVLASGTMVIAAYGDANAIYSAGRFASESFNAISNGGGKSKQWDRFTEQIREKSIDVSSWNKGSFDSIEESVARHYYIHGSEVGASSIEQYIRKAEGFKLNLSGATKSYIDGAVEGVMRYKKNGKYIDLAPDGTIISFGKIFNR